MPRDAYIHQRRQGRPGAALLFLFHGTGGDERQLLDLGADLSPEATLVSPRGDVLEQGAARFFRRTGEGVYDMDDLARATAKMVGFVESHRDGHAPVDGLGYSNGANVLAAVLFARPDLFDAVTLMHPLIPFEPVVKGDLAGKRILMTAGRRDPICPPTLTRRFEAHLRHLEADVAVEWHEGGHEMRPNEIDAAKRFFAEREGRQMSGDGIGFEETGSKGRYFIRTPDGDEAEMTFTKIGEHQLIIDHTDVPDAFRGQGAGVKLVTRAVEDARAAGKTIIPLCPFANAQFRRHPEWADVLKK